MDRSPKCQTSTRILSHFLYVFVWIARQECYKCQTSTQILSHFLYVLVWIARQECYRDWKQSLEFSLYVRIISLSLCYVDLLPKMLLGLQTSIRRLSCRHKFYLYHSKSFSLSLSHKFSLSVFAFEEDLSPRMSQGFARPNSGKCETRTGRLQSTLEKQCRGGRASPKVLACFLSKGWHTRKILARKKLHQSARPKKMQGGAQILSISPPVYV